jgi:hypothetical protein
MLSPRTAAAFGEDAALCGRFAAIAGPGRVLLDPALRGETFPSSYAAAFQVAPERALAPLPRLRFVAAPLDDLPPLPAAFYLTRRTAPGLPAFELTPGGTLRAVELERLRRAFR